MTKIKISWPAGELTATLHATPTTARLLEALPFEASAQTWGEEVYFSTPVKGASREANAQQVVPAGTVCFWLDGNAMALPYGPTPISQGDECRLASPCNLLGVFDGDATQLASVCGGDTIRVALV